MQARSSSSNQLELRFRPEDPYCHPAFGELHLCENTFLLKISKRSRESADSSVTEVQDDESTVGRRQLGNQYATSASNNMEEDQTHLCADIVARVSEAYSFKGWDQISYGYFIQSSHVNVIQADFFSVSKWIFY